MTWSPQQYLDEGVRLGRDPQVLATAITQIERVALSQPSLPAILTLNHLAERTRVPYLSLRGMIAGSQVSYRHFRIRKRSGGYRLISVPYPDLMAVQRWIAKYVLNLQHIHDCCFAFKPGSSIVKCAALHSGARWLVKLDVAGFFGSISEIQVYRVFQSLGYEPLVAFELARLTTYAPARSARYEHLEWQARPHPSPIDHYRRSRIGFLPQGAPTSPMLSNLIMRDSDAEIAEVARRAGVRYSRYSDDLTFSTRSDDFNRKRAAALIRDVTLLLGRIGLKVNPTKTVVASPGARKIVLGLLVDGARPRLPKRFRSALRQHLYYLEVQGPFEHASRRNFDSVWGMYRHVRGLIDFANMVDQEYAQEMLMRFEAVEWPTFSTETP